MHRTGRNATKNAALRAGINAAPPAIRHARTRRIAEKQQAKILGINFPLEI
jgi:hypothetical protein